MGKIVKVINFTAITTRSRVDITTMIVIVTTNLVYRNLLIG